MKVLITGAHRFLGHQVSAAFLQAGSEVRGLVPGGSGTVLDGVECLRGDASDLPTLARATRGVDTVLHLASRSSDRTDWARTFEANVHSTDNLLRAAIASGCRRFVLLSSLAVHRPVGHRGANEDTPRDHFDHPQAASRIQAERLVEHASGRREIEGVIVRPGTLVLGPGASRNLDALHGYLRLGLVPLIDGGLARTCFSYTENLAAGVLLAATHPDAAHRSFVMEDGICVSWRHVLATLSRLLTRAHPIFVPVPGELAALTARLLEASSARRRVPPALTRYRVDLMRADTHFVSDRARTLLGYTPRIGFYEALERSVQAWRGALP